MLQVVRRLDASCVQVTSRYGWARGLHGVHICHGLQACQVACATLYTGVPLPEARDLEELNAYLEQCCKQDQRRILDGRTETVGTAMLHEQPHLMPLVARSLLV